jgi:hypothetical protein
MESAMTTRTKHFAKAAQLCFASFLVLGTVLAHAQYVPGRTFTYTVLKGDTVQSVSQTYLDEPTRFNEVAAASKLRNPNRIYPGDKLSIPIELLRGTAVPMTISASNGNVTLDGKPAQVGMPVNEGAKLQTAEGATAVLTREDGTQMSVLPNSIAELVKNRSIDKEAGLLRSSIRLASGAMDFVVQKLGLKDHVKVNTPTSTIGVRGTQYRVGAKDKSSKVEVLEGTVAADAAKASGTPLALNGGFGTLVPEGGKPLGAIALLPAPKLVNLDAGAQLIRATNTVNIAPVAGAVAYAYVVSPEGKPEVRALEGRSDKASFELPRLPDAKYQIAVRAVDKNGLDGFDTLTAFSVAVIDTPFALENKPQSDGVVVQWQDGMPNSLYLVQLARDASFKDIVSLGYVRERQALMKDVEPGQYFWRVGEPKTKGATTPETAGGWDFSDAQTFTAK